MRRPLRCLVPFSYITEMDLERKEYLDDTRKNIWMIPEIPFINVCKLRMLEGYSSYNTGVVFLHLHPVQKYFRSLNPQFRS